MKDDFKNAVQQLSITRGEISALHNCFKKTLTLVNVLYGYIDDTEDDLCICKGYELLEILEEKLREDSTSAIEIYLELDKKVKEFSGILAKYDIEE